MALINCPECTREISDKAGACPHCGLPLEKTIPVKPVETLHDPNKKTCPTCKTENTQSIKMMCLSGTSSGSSTGVGISTDLDIGVGRMNTNSKTALAEKYASGSNPANVATGCGCFSIIVCIVLIMTTLSEPGGGIFLWVFGPLILLALYKWQFLSEKIKNNPQQKEWEAKVKLYEEGWICHKCGNTWLP